MNQLRSGAQHRRRQATAQPLAVNVSASDAGPSRRAARQARGRHARCHGNRLLARAGSGPVR
eukprot:6849617-Prymnesium_polylepis.1